MKKNNILNTHKIYIEYLVDRVTFSFVKYIDVSTKIKMKLPGLFDGYNI